MKVYLAGPMTGLPEHNYPAFMKWAHVLRQEGHEVVNPAENHDGRVDLPLEEYFATDLPQICRCDAVAVLPGWEDSRGATLEVALARHLGHKVLDVRTMMRLEYDVSEQDVVLETFTNLLRAATKDGGRKRAAGEKPPWWRDPAHEAAIFSHLNKWKHGERIDPDSGTHPLVHLAWRALAIAYQEIEGQVDPMEAR